eukprot:772275-Alexandrium_andersonii.AAC.1
MCIRDRPSSGWFRLPHFGATVGKRGACSAFPLDVGHPPEAVTERYVWARGGRASGHTHNRIIFVLCLCARVASCVAQVARAAR